MDRKGDFIGVYGGKKFWPLDPRPEDVDMIGVAHALSQVCRFNGHTKFHWSIAQHSLLVEKILSEYMGQHDNYRIRLIGLLHDASEAYISDLLRPFKKDVVGYKEIEEAVEDSILEYCGLTNITEKEHEMVKQADNSALILEALTLMNPGEDWSMMGFWNDKLEPYKQEIKKEDTSYIKYKFTTKCGNLMDKLNIQVPWRQETEYIGLEQIYNGSEL